MSDEGALSTLVEEVGTLIERVIQQNTDLMRAGAEVLRAHGCHCSVCLHLAETILASLRAARRGNNKKDKKS